MKELKKWNKQGFQVLDRIYHDLRKDDGTVAGVLRGTISFVKDIIGRQNDLVDRVVDKYDGKGFKLEPGMEVYSTDGTRIWPEQQDNLDYEKCLRCKLDGNCSFQAMSCVRECDRSALEQQECACPNCEHEELDMCEPPCDKCETSYSNFTPKSSPSVTSDAKQADKGEMLPSEHFCDLGYPECTTDCLHLVAARIVDCRHRIPNQEHTCGNCEREHSGADHCRPHVFRYHPQGCIGFTPKKSPVHKDNCHVGELRCAVHGWVKATRIEGRGGYFCPQCHPDQKAKFLDVPDKIELIGRTNHEQTCGRCSRPIPPYCSYTVREEVICASCMCDEEKSTYCCPAFKKAVDLKDITRDSKDICWMFGDYNHPLATCPFKGCGAVLMSDEELKKMKAEYPDYDLEVE